MKLLNFSRSAKVQKGDTAATAGKPTPTAPKNKNEKITKEKGQKPSKSSSGSRKRRFVFIIGDEGAILVFMEGKTVLKRLFSPSADIENIATFRQMLEANPHTPIFMLVDMIDQSYVKHTLPPVTKLSVQRLIKRRLERDFGPEDITGALPLGREKGGRKDWNYMLISVAGSPQLMQWLDFVLELENPFEGLYLVPIEAATFVSELSKKSLAKNATSWQLLVCHNKISGFRQVIFKDGRLTFTRLAQPINDTSPEVVAGNIEQEIGNTIEYLKRLSYSEDEGIDCFLIVASEIKRYIESSKIRARNVVTLTPFEASELLSLNKALQPEDHYADVVFASFFGASPKKILPLQSTFSGILFKYRKRIKMSLVAASILGGLLLVFTAFTAMEIIPKTEEINTLETQLRSISALIQESNKKVDSLPKETDRMEDMVFLHKVFSTNKEQAMQFIKDFKIAASNDIIVKKISWKDNTKMEDVFNKLPLQITIDMDVEFTNTTGTVDAFAQKARAFFDRARSTFPQYIMTYSKLPSIIDQAQAFRAEFKDSANAESKEMMSGEPVIISLKFVTAPTNLPTTP